MLVSLVIGAGLRVSTLGVVAEPVGLGGDADGALFPLLLGEPLGFPLLLLPSLLGLLPLRREGGNDSMRVIVVLVLAVLSNREISRNVSILNFLDRTLVGLS